MADTGLTLVGTGANIAGSGADWSNPSNITVEDSNYADALVQKNGGLSDYLRGTNCGFAIPSGATINGVELQIRIRASISGNLFDEYVYLVENGSIILGCNNKASGTAWPDTEITRTYGGSSELWGCTLTPTIINSGTFGFQIMTEHTGTLSNRRTYVYWAKIKVYYTESGGSSSIKSIANVVQASIKSIAGVAEANIKSVAGVSN